MKDFNFTPAEMIFLHLISCFLIILLVFAPYAEPGGEAVLRCRVLGAVTVVQWTKEGLPPDEYVFFYRNGRSYEKYQHASFRGRVLPENSAGFEDGDVSVVLKNVSLEDNGTYRCRVLTSGAGTEGGEHVEVVHLGATMHSDVEEEAGKIQRVVTGETGPNFPVLIGVLTTVCVAAAAGVGFYVCRRKKTRNRQQRGQEEVV